MSRCPHRDAHGGGEVVEVRVCERSELVGRRKLITLGAREIVVLEHDGRLYAFSNHCLHQGGPVGEGKLIGRVRSRITEGGEHLGDYFSDESTHIVCPWHGYEFELDGGACAALPERRLQHFPVREAGGEVFVTI